MFQDIIALLIVLAAIVYTTVGFINLLNNKKENSCNCGSCDIKSEIHKLKLQKKI